MGQDHHANQPPPQQLCIPQCSKCLQDREEPKDAGARGPHHGFMAWVSLPLRVQMFHQLLRAPPPTWGIKPRGNLFLHLLLGPSHSGKRVHAWRVNAFSCTDVVTAARFPVQTSPDLPVSAWAGLELPWVLLERCSLKQQIVITLPEQKMDFEW